MGQIIPEVVELEENEESPAKKPRRKSVSAIAVMQKIDDTPSKRRGRPPKSVGNEESEPKSAKKQVSGKASMTTIIEEEKELKTSPAKHTPRKKSLSTSAVTTSKLDDTPKKGRGRPSKNSTNETIESKSPKNTKNVTIASTSKVVDI